jgi:hypothetical protein
MARFARGLARRAVRHCESACGTLAVLAIVAAALVAAPTRAHTTLSGASPGIGGDSPKVAMASSTAVGDGVGDQTACGGAGQRACCLTERPVGPSCNSGLTEVSGCEGDCRCGGANPFGISSSGTCYTLDSDGYPPTCGGKNENACTVDLQLLPGSGRASPA